MVHRLLLRIRKEHHPHCQRIFTSTQALATIGGPCVLSRSSRIQLFETLWTVVCLAPSAHEILQARILEWVVMCSSRISSQTKDQTHVS